MRIPRRAATRAGGLPGPSHWPDHQRAAAAAIALAAFLFGTSFPIIKAGLDGHVRAVPYLAIRFSIGTAVLLAVTARRGPVRFDRGLLRDGCIAGFLYLAGLTCQTLGLQDTTPATSAFLTYLLVVIVPIVSFLAWRERITSAQVMAISASVIGLALLTGGGVGFGKGEVLTVLAAVALATHLVVIGRNASRHDLFAFHAVRAATVAVPLLVVAPFTGGLPHDGWGWALGVYAGVVITAVVVVPWTWAQRHLPPTRAALIFLLEPVFALFASYLNGERLTLTAGIGATIILAAAAMSELGAQRRNSPRRAPPLAP